MLYLIASYQQYADLFLQSIGPIHAQSSRWLAPVAMKILRRKRMS